MFIRKTAHRSFFQILQLVGVYICLTILAGDALAQDREARDNAFLNEIRDKLELSAEVTDAELKAQLQPLLDRREANFQRRRQAESTTVRDAVESVSTVVRCGEGYVASRTIQPGADNVVIRSEQPKDCDAVGCRALQVDAARANPVPFSLSVSVSCTG